MVKFYAPWCPACRAVESTWNELAEWAENEGEDVSVGSVDVTAQPALNGRFMITALPTIYHVKDGVFRRYNGDRGLEDFKEFITEKKWNDIDPMSSWMGPNSALMGFMSKLFDFSIMLKDYHESFSRNYGVPAWASLLLFGLILIAAGLIMGMVLVLMADYIWPPPPSKYGQMKKNDTPVNDDPKNNEDSTEEGEGEKKDGDSTDDSKEEESIRQRKVQKSED